MPVRRSHVSVRGFSLIELLAVLAILALLASIGMPLAELAHRRAEEEELRRALRDIRSAIDAYKRLSDTGHVAVSLGSSGYPPDLTVLVEGFRDIQSPQGARIYLLRRLPRDPLAPAGLSAAQTWALRSYESPPDAPEAGDDVFDVHSKVGGAGLDGTLYAAW